MLRKSKGSICVEDHVWGEGLGNLRPPYDMVIGTDVVYREDIINPLVQSVCAMSNHETQVIIANEIRSRRFVGHVLFCWCFLRPLPTLTPSHLNDRILDLYFKRMTERFKFQRLSLSLVDDLFETEVYEAFSFKLKKPPAPEPA